MSRDYVEFVETAVEVS